MNDQTQDKDDARDQAEAQMRSVKALVAALSVDYDRLAELIDERNSLERDAHQEYNEGEDCDEAKEARAALAEWRSEYAQELADLIDEANGAKTQSDAFDRIYEDALSVEVRSAWTIPGNGYGAGEFRIVLCTGGPHVQIRGQLDDDSEPTRAWLEYMGWGAPVREYFGPENDCDALLQYASVFNFSN